MSVYSGQVFTFSHGTHTFRATIEHDDCADAPWDACDGHGSVRKTMDPRTKNAGEVVLHVGDRGCYSFVYDFAAAVRTARKDGWNTAPFDTVETAGERAVRAVKADMEYLRGWCADDWEYVNVTVELLDEEGEPQVECCASLCNCESIGDYVEREIVHELAEQVLHEMVLTVG